MPELPEVETIRRGLSSRVVGQVICGVRLGARRILKVPAQRLVRAVRGQVIRGLERRGKFLIFELDRHYCVLHLGMTGQLTVREPEQRDASRFLRHPITGLQRARQHAPDHHTHLQLFFESGRALLFRDVRQFGKVFLLDKKPTALIRFFAHLGLEPLSPEYTLQSFLQKFRKRKLRIKSLLLDQSFVAGVGNIYADEALFEAGIHPRRTVRSLRRREKEQLFEAIPAVLERGITWGGTTLRDFVNSDGEAGNHQEELKVYGRTGQPCLRCGCPIQRVVISQRGTHFCPGCQSRRGARPRSLTL